MTDTGSTRTPGAVLFDIDGTLVDSNYVHVNAWEHALRAVGYPVDTWRIHRGQGMGSSQLLATLLGEVAVALQRAQVTPDKAVFVGDTVWDVHACEKAGVACVGMLSGGISVHELIEAGAIAVYDDCRALLHELDTSPLAAV